MWGRREKTKEVGKSQKRREKTNGEWKQPQGWEEGEERRGEGEKPQKGGTNRRVGNPKGWLWWWWWWRENQTSRKEVGENRKDEKHQTNVGKPNVRQEKLRRNLKTRRGRWCRGRRRTKKKGWQGLGHFFLLFSGRVEIKKYLLEIEIILSCIFSLYYLSYLISLFEMIMKSYRSLYMIEEILIIDRFDVYDNYFIDEKK